MKIYPIYTIIKKINELFNEKGIAQLDDWHDIPEFVDLISKTGLDCFYLAMKEAIEDSFKRVEPYKTPWKERFFRDYGDLLEDMIHGY